MLYNRRTGLAESYIDFVVNTHSLYDRYYKNWKLCENSWYGGVEYQDAQYLRAYQVDLNTPSETVNMYVTESDGSIVAKQRAKVEYGYSQEATNRGQDPLDGSFYLEKLDNTPLYNYVKLIVAEYNAILFRNPPQRVLPETPEVEQFIYDVDGEGNSVSEFMSLVDMYTTVFGVCHVGCYKPIGSDIPRWRVHKPTDVTNWDYQYDRDGNLKMTRIAIRVEETVEHSVYRVITADTIDTVFVGNDEDYMPPEIEDLVQIDDAVYVVSQPNELGYIPIRTFYQSTKIYNNVGSTVIQDVSGIQRSIYGDLAEIYSSITYGSHPTLIVDETTSQLNDGAVGSEPGAVITVQSGLTGESNYVYEFASPKLDSIEQIQKLIDSKIEKLSQVAMLRSEELIRSARSGEQIEVYDDKLSAQIRRKATNLENGEAKLWDIWFDWTNQAKPEDFSISYNRHYNKRALENEIQELDAAMQLLSKYKTQFMKAPPSEEFPTAEEAIGRAQQLGGTGYHSHTMEDGTVVYMPFPTHEEYETAIGFETDPEEQMFQEEIKETIKTRLTQLLKSTSTNNGF